MTIETFLDVTRGPEMRRLDHNHAASFVEEHPDHLKPVRSRRIKVTPQTLLTLAELLGTVDASELAGNLTAAAINARTEPPHYDAQVARMAAVAKIAAGEDPTKVAKALAASDAAADLARELRTEANEHITANTWRQLVETGETIVTAHLAPYAQAAAARFLDAMGQAEGVTDDESAHRSGDAQVIAWQAATRARLDLTRAWEVATRLRSMGVLHDTNRRVPDAYWAFEYPLLVTDRRYTLDHLDPDRHPNLGLLEAIDNGARPTVRTAQQLHETHKQVRELRLQQILANRPARAHDIIRAEFDQGASPAA